MSCTSTNPGGFPTATQMDQMALNISLVTTEECAIQQAILAAASQCQPGGGKNCVTVGGNTPMTFVSGVSSVTVNNGGLNYYQDSPMAVIVPPLNSPNSPGGAVLALVTNGGNITAVNVTSPGSGYQPVNASISVTSLLGTGAVLQPLVDGTGTIVSVNILSAGANYTTNDTVTAIRAVAPQIYFVNAVIKITAVSITGGIVSTAVLTGGSGYQPSVATVQIVSTINPSVPYPLGTGFTSNVLLNNTGGVSGVVVTNTGFGYAVDPPYLVITDPGTGAQTQVTLGTGPNATSVASITVTAPGSGYDQSAVGTVFNPPTAAVAATAAATLFAGVFTGITGLIGGGFYTSVPSVTITGDGVGASATAVISGGRVVGLTSVVGGSGYTHASVVFAPPSNPPNPTPAVVIINVPLNTYGTNPNLYWQVWMGTQTNTAIQNQLNAVLAYFTGLGYTIQLQSNPATGSTLQWHICW